VLVYKLTIITPVSFIRITEFINQIRHISNLNHLHFQGSTVLLETQFQYKQSTTQNESHQWMNSGLEYQIKYIGGAKCPSIIYILFMMILSSSRINISGTKFSNSEIIFPSLLYLGKSSNVSQRCTIA